MSDEILELARKPRPGTWGRSGSPGARYVRTPEGSQKYSLPIGARITADAIARAERRGRSYNVPEDDKAFGSQAPAAGRTQRSAKEIVAAIRNAPAPRRVTPEGPKKVAVGNSGFSFPEGSRTFRPREHQNFAIVRTPDYQLYVATDKGIAFELDGDLENELNEELDDDASENFDVDDPRDPNELTDVDGDGETGQAARAPEAAARPARVEDSPGFLSEDRIQDILTGMEQSGLDQNTRDMTELQLRRNNDRIRQEYEAGDANEQDVPEADADGGDGRDSNAPATAADAKDDDSRRSMETTPQPTPDRQPDTSADSGNESSESDEVNALVDEIEAEADAKTERKTGEPVTTPRSSASRRSSRPRRKRQAPADDAPAETTPDESVAALEELARSRPNGVAEGDVNGKRVAVRRNRVNDEMEYSVDDQSVADRAELVTRASEPVEPEERDTTGLDPADMTDDELADVLADIDDLLVAGAVSRREARARRAELNEEIQRRSGTDSDSGNESVEEAPARTNADIASGITNTPFGQGDYTNVPERDDIINAQPGDSFTVMQNGTESTWFVGTQRRLHPTTSADGPGIDREVMADLYDGGDIDMRAHTGNGSNGSSSESAQPGDPATREWARSAKPGAAAIGSDGVVAERNEDGTWETPLGTVDESFFDSTDVENEAGPSVVRNEADPDGRPVGATRELNTPEDLESVQNGDGLKLIWDDGGSMVATRNDDGTFTATLDNGMTAPGLTHEDLLDVGARVWHVPNQDLTGTPSKKNWAPGDRIRTLDDLLSQRTGTTFNRRYGPSNDSTIVYTLTDDQRMTSEQGLSIPAQRFSQAISQGQLSINTLPDLDDEDRQLPTPRVVTDPADYQTGDVISDYRHVRDMRPGQQVTLVVPAAQNGGREAHVVMTRTGDEADLGGFMFLVGNGGRGYNSFGENNASIFQAIYDGRLLYGNLDELDGTPQERLEGDWSREKNIEAWPDGPMISEYDLRTYIASQVAANAMQKSYFDPSFLPDDSPFRSSEFRRAFASKAKEKYSTPGNPMRSKPASIRMAAELLGLQYTDPGSTLIPENLTLEDFRRRVTIGSWLRRNGSPENPAERNMGPERLEVTAADIKTALAAMDNMLDPTDDREDPDKILKRVFARQGSPLQDLNTSVAIAAYFGMKRYKVDEFGNRTPVTTIGRQYDKRRNKALLRQMLLEQLEGREPGFYGIPEDEEYERNGQRFVNTSTLERPSAEEVVEIPTPSREEREALEDQNAPTVPEPVDGGAVNDGVVEPAPVTDFSQMTDDQLRDHIEDLAEQRNLRERAYDPWDDAEQAEFDRAQEELRSREQNGPAASGIREGRLDALDDYDNVGDAYMDARRNADAADYIREVLGDGAMDQVASGERSLRHLFQDAWRQRNGQQAEPDVPQGAQTNFERAHELSQTPSGARIIGTSPEGRQEILTVDGDRITLESINTSRNREQSREAFRRWIEAGWTFEVHDSSGVPETSSPDSGNDSPVSQGGSTISVGDTIPPGMMSALGTGSQVDYHRTNGTFSRYTRREDGWYTESGNALSSDPATWSDRARFTVRSVEGVSSESAPELTLVADARALADLPENTVVIRTDPNGSTERLRATTNDYGDPILRGVDDPTIGRRRSPDFTRLDFDNGVTYAVESSPAQAGDTAPTSPYRQGETFRGADIQTAPVGSHVRGASGREYRITENGIQELRLGTVTNFDAVERHNAVFTYLGDTAPDAPSTSEGTHAIDARVGSVLDASELMDYPDGGRFRSSGGTIWTRRGSTLVSDRGARRRIRNVTGRYRFIGTGTSPMPQATGGRPTPASDNRTLEEAGLTRVPREDIERYDRPRPVPAVAFDTSNTDDFASYISTPEGIENLRQAILGALPDGSSVSVRRTGGGFTASYSTPDGAHGEMTRGLRANGRIENEVARASGANFAGVQDHLFAFYRQHGLREVEVHGLSGQNWNGAHTWIRRGFRPDPTRESSNIGTLAGLRDSLSRVIRSTENGTYPQYQEFLEESKELQRRMTEFLNNWQNMQIDERQEQIYQLWRDLTYLGEVRDANGQTARGNRQSIGWRLLGNRSGGAWYYGVRSLDDYFE